MGSALPQTDRVPRRGRGARSAARPAMGHSTRSESAGYSSRSGRCGTARPIRTCGSRHPGKARRRIATFCTLVRRGREFGRATIRGRCVRRAFGHLGYRTTGPTEEVPDKHSRQSGRFSLQNGEFRAYTRRNADHMGRSPYSPLRTLPARQSSFNVARSGIANGADGAQSTLPACTDMLSLIALSSDVISASGTTLMDSMTPIFRRRISSMFT